MLAAWRDIMKEREWWREALTHLVESLTGALLDTAAGQSPEADMTDPAPTTARLLLAVLNQRSRRGLRHHRPRTALQLHGLRGGGGGGLDCWGRGGGR